MVGKGLGKELIDNKEASTDSKEKSRDILSILGSFMVLFCLVIYIADSVSLPVDANRSQDAINRLSLDEILSQVT